MNTTKVQLNAPATALSTQNISINKQSVNAGNSFLAFANQLKQDERYEEAETRQNEIDTNVKYEKWLNQQKKVNYLTIQNAYQKDLKQLETIEDPKTYKEELTKLEQKAADMFNSGVDSELAGKYMANMEKDINTKYAKKVSEVTSEKLLNAIQNSNNNWKEVQKTFDGIAQEYKDDPTALAAALNTYANIQKGTEIDDMYRLDRDARERRKLQLEFNENDKKDAVTNYDKYMKVTGHKPGYVFANKREADNAYADFKRKYARDNTTASIAKAFFKYNDDKTGKTKGLTDNLNPITIGTIVPKDAEVVREKATEDQTLAQKEMNNTKTFNKISELAKQIYINAVDPEKVKELTKKVNNEFNAAVPNIPKHQLRMLENKGFITLKQDGKNPIYEVNTTDPFKLKKTLDYINESAEYFYKRVGQPKIKEIKPGSVTVSNLKVDKNTVNFLNKNWDKLNDYQKADTAIKIVTSSGSVLSKLYDDIITGKINPTTHKLNVDNIIDKFTNLPESVKKSEIFKQTLQNKLNEMKSNVSKIIAISSSVPYIKDAMANTAHYNPYTKSIEINLKNGSPTTLSKFLLGYTKKVAPNKIGISPTMKPTLIKILSYSGSDKKLKTIKQKLLIDIQNSAIAGKANKRFTSNYRTLHFTAESLKQLNNTIAPHVKAWLDTQGD